MRCPTLTELPPPPPGKIGWPWTIESRRLPERRPDGSPWPRISIVTPSYNQGEFIEETIRSILLQGYPELEYIIIDGASKDDTVAVVEKYAPWLAHWESEKDRGQAHAINKGYARCTGEVIQWINSDDFLAPDVLGIIGGDWGGASCIAGVVVNFDDKGAEDVVNVNLTARNLITGRGGVRFHQPGIWMKRACMAEIGGVHETLSYCFDSLMTIKYLHRFPQVHYVPDRLVHFRIHSGSMTGNFDRLYRDAHVNLLKILAAEPGHSRIHIAARHELARRRFHAWVAARKTAEGADEPMPKLPPSLLMDRFVLGFFRRAAVANLKRAIGRRA
jgi:glycosyltransferase involved in cell wall biosynthesis